MADKWPLRLIETPYAAALLAVLNECPTCQGQGQVQTGEDTTYVTHEMAMDAGNLELEGSEYGVTPIMDECPDCQGLTLVCNERSLRAAALAAVNAGMGLRMEEK